MKQPNNRDTGNRSLDLGAVIRATQAISGEIDMARLLEQMMRIVIASAGAQRGALILERAGRWLIEAQGEAERQQVSVLQALDLGDSTALSAEIVSFVARTRQRVVLDDAARAGDFTGDPYVIRHRIRSVLCVPLIDQVRLSGILYLEQNLSAGAFTAERLELLNLLSTQMALALDNASLYQKAQQELAERRRIEAELRTSESRYRALVQSQIDLISRYLPDTNLTFVNDAYCQFYGKTREELIGRSFLLMVAPEFHAQARKETEDFLKDPRPIAGEYINYRWDGTECWIHWILQGIVDEHGVVTEIQATGRDITLVKQAEQALRDKERAEAANRAKSAFLAHMNHELRSPLNAILGFSDLMQREARAGRQPLTPAQEQNLARIQRSGEHLLTLINNVLDLSKIEAGRETLSPTTISLPALLEDVEQMFTLMAANKGLSLRVERSAQLPRFIDADAVKLRQVLINLLNNAIKFTDAGGVTLRITTYPAERAPGDTGYIQVEVADTGPGIAPEDIARLFEAFAPLSSRRAESGAGLGLSISHQLARLMGGELTVESALGQGACFRFSIPLQESAAPWPPAAPAEPRALALLAHQPGYRILLADDDEQNRQLLRQLLQPLGFITREVSNGQEAVAVWSEWQPHLIVMDIRMPVLDGTEASRQIKAMPRGAETSIIALSASAFAEERAAVLAAGCDDFLRKPFREAELLGLIERHLVLHLQAGPASPAAAETPQPHPGLDHIPAALLAELDAALVRANMGEVNRLIAAIEPYDPAAARMFGELADRFEYPQIGRIMRASRPELGLAQPPAAPESYPGTAS